VNVSVSTKATPWLKSNSVTGLGISHANIVQFMIRRATVGGTAVLPLRSSETWVSNWNTAEVNELAIQANGAYLDFTMESNTYIPESQFTTYHKVQLVSSMTFRTQWLGGWIKRVLPVLSVKADELVQRINDHTVRVTLPTFSGTGGDKYDINFPETGIMEIPASLTTRQHSHPYTQLIIRPSPGGTLFSNYPHSCTEKRLREGCPREVIDPATERPIMQWFPCTLEFQLGGFKDGHYEFKTFSVANGRVFADRMKGIIKDGGSGEAKGFNNAIRPALGHPAHAVTNFALTDEKKTLVVNLPIADGKYHGYTQVPNNLYDITMPEAIAVGIPADLIDPGEGSQAPEQPFGSFVIQPDPEGTLMGCTEQDIRGGGKFLKLWLGDDKYIAAGLASKFQAGITSGYVPWGRQAAGWMATVATVLAASASAHVLNTGNTLLTITLPAVSGYSIDYAEIVNVNIPAAVVVSNKIYNDGNGPFFARFMIWAAPASSSTLLTSDATTEALVRAGGKTIEFKLDPLGSVSFSSAPTCSVLFAEGFKTDNTWSSGFAAVIENVKSQVAAQISVGAHLLTFTVPAFPDYQISSAEEVTFEVPQVCLTGSTENFKWAPFTINPGS